MSWSAVAWSLSKQTAPYYLWAVERKRKGIGRVHERKGGKEKERKEREEKGGKKRNERRKERETKGGESLSVCDLGLRFEHKWVSLEVSLISPLAYTQTSRRKRYRRAKMMKSTTSSQRGASCGIQNLSKKKGPSTLGVTTLPSLQPQKGQPQLFLTLKIIERSIKFMWKCQWRS